MIARNTLRAAAAVGLVGMLTLGATNLSTSHAAATKAPMWLTYNAKTKTANVTIIAAYKGGFDFNGYSKGQLKITVPTGTKIVTTFTNAASIPHSVEYVPFTMAVPVTAPKPAFMGAGSPNYVNGVSKGAKAQVFSFTANKAGKYYIICAVPGHAVAGMWDTLIVGSAKTASISTK